eukprot:4299247-Amphidinium_carterae.1
MQTLSTLEKRLELSVCTFQSSSFCDKDLVPGESVNGRFCSVRALYLYSPFPFTMQRTMQCDSHHKC